MNIKPLNISLIKTLKKKLFPFYKSKEITKIFKILEKDLPKNTRVAMFVGGCVRKFLSNEEIDDIDVATIFSPNELKKKFNDTDIKIVDTGIEHGSITVISNELKIEFTTLRKDLSTDGRHAEISFTDNWKEDSNRRDFTMNAIYMDRKGKIFDPQLGVHDLNNKIVKFIGDPNKRIQEDFLRIIRFIRFANQYSSKIEYQTINAINLNINGIQKISKERILNELLKILNLENFQNIAKNKDLKKIFYLVFPEFRYLDRLEKNYFKISLKLRPEILISIMLIDDTDNHEYFIHKYKVSNNTRDKLNFLSNCLRKNKLDKEFFGKKLIKNIYFFGKENLEDFNILKFFMGKGKNLESFLDIQKKIKKVLIPKMPYSGSFLLSRGLKEGKKLGQIQKKLEISWVENNFSLNKNQIDEIINSNS